MAYQRVTREFASQKSAVAEARRLLAALSAPPSTTLATRLIMGGASAAYSSDWSLSSDGRYLTMVDATGISIRDLATVIAEATGYNGEIVWDASKPNGQPRRRLDVERAKEQFGFTSRTPFREGVERTVAWYRAQVPSVTAG